MNIATILANPEVEEWSQGDWNTVFIACFVMVVIALMLEPLGRRLRQKELRKRQEWRRRNHPTSKGLPRK